MVVGEEGFKGSGDGDGAIVIRADAADNIGRADTAGNAGRADTVDSVDGADSVDSVGPGVTTINTIKENR